MYEDMLSMSHDQGTFDAPQFFQNDDPSSSPSPPSNGGGVMGAGSRRPPRKSTLTQQQKNQKRQRATQDQLITLEVEFNKNPTPSAVVRERIAQEINMTERSVQIWFQNRRAKIKLLAKKSLEAGEDCDDIPESVRIYLANQNPELRALTRMGPGGNRLSGYGPEGLLAPDHSTPGKIVIHHFACRSLSVGSWRRVGQNAMDLVIFYSPEKAILTYYINNDSAGYKIEFPFAYIKSIELETLNVPMTHQNAHTTPQGQLVITLLRPPHFFMDTSGSGGFVQCGDFTEDQQATQVMVHRLGGNPKSLQQQLAKLLNLEVFQNRHMQQGLFDAAALSVSAPVSPHHAPPRPSSASGMAPPPAFMQREVPRQPFGNMRGHRRQRSRSVPIAIDFSQLHQPMPSFNFEEAVSEGEGEQKETLCAPTPQHPHAASNNLRIDTSAPGFLDYRAYPLSAATTASVSEYATSPGLLNTGMPADIAHSAGMPSPYGNMPWLSPMMDPTHPPQSVSPLSTLGQGGEPVIASGSPPLIDRSGSAELFPLSHPDQTFNEEGLSELYAKQSIVMPMHTPNLEDIDDLQSFNLSPMPQMSMSPEGNSS